MYLHCLGVIQLKCLRAQWLEVLYGGLCFEFQFFLGVYFVLGRDPQHTAILAQAEILGLHDDVECLIPWNVFEPQRQSPSHSVRCHDVEVGEIRDDLQQRTDFDILEIKRQLFPVITSALRQFCRIDLACANLDDKLVFTLVSAVFPIAFGFDGHANAVTSLLRRHQLHRSCEIGHVDSAAQPLRQCRLGKFDHQVLSYLFDIDPDLVIGQVDNDAPTALGSKTKIDILQRDHIAIPIFRKRRRSASGHRQPRDWLKGHQQ